MIKLNAQEKRIAAIFDEDAPPEVIYDNLSRYLAYLTSNLKLPCHLTGIEDFQWEERYVIGGGNQKEYEKLKLTQPSFRDTFNFISFDDQINEDYGLLVNIKRLSDNRKFTLPLADLEASDVRSTNYQLIHDYVVWFVNNV